MMKFRSALMVFVLAACAGDADVPAVEQAPLPPAEPAATAEWPGAGSDVNLRRERSVDLTGDGAAETVSVTARGTRWDSVDIALTIEANRDTLWHDAWSSMHYFKYDTLDGKADSTVMRIVQEHVDSLLADSRFTERGPPPRLTQGARTTVEQREAVRYHLAELDWRGRADLTPADELPPDAHSRIDASRVAPERVAVVLEELTRRPSFWYYAGGEETYAIAWSEREHAFVRLYSCC